MDISSAGDLKQQIARVNSSKVQSTNVVSISDSVEKESPKKEAPSRELVDDSVRKMNDYVQNNLERDLSFSVDEETGHDVVRVVDSSTDELIRQFPSEEFLTISKNIGDMKGLLFKDII